MRLSMARARSRLVLVFMAKKGFFAQLTSLIEK